MVDNKQQWKAWLYLAPALLLLLVFTVWPIINTLRMAFLEGYNGHQELVGVTFNVGISNFLRVLTAPSFKYALENTLVLCVITVPLSTLLALLIAVGLNSIKPLQKTLQTIFFLPYVTNSIAIGMVFNAMFNILGLSPNGMDADSWGIINNILMAFGADPINWVNPGATHEANIAVLVVYIVWNALPFKILVLLGGLQGINKQYYEAARVDGTPKWRVFGRITVPLLSPMLAYVIITGFIGGFKEYSSVIGIYGDPLPAELNTMVGLVYSSLKSNLQGQASAAALILFVIILAVTMFNDHVIKKYVHY